ncbi:hypothetical protein pb186bvf_016935 [Paramecium bursaria]
MSKINQNMSCDNITMLISNRQSLLLFTIESIISFTSTWNSRIK